MLAERRDPARDLDVDADADAELLRVTALPARLLVRTQLLVPGGRERLVERALEVADVVRLTDADKKSGIRREGCVFSIRFSAASSSHPARLAWV